MSLCEIAGDGAAALLQRLQTRSLAAFEPGRLAYTLLLRDDGSVFIDATVWRHADGRWWLFTGRRGDVAWLADRAAGFDARIRDRSGEFAVLALQGPSSGLALGRLIGEQAVRGLRYFHFLESRLAGVRSVIGRLGYSGELGYEAVIPATEACAARRAVLDASRGLGIAECSFDAADSLRIEAGYVLFGREIGMHETPQELGLERFVDRPRRRSPSARRLVGLEILERPAVARPRSDLPLARATSECDSPIFGRRIALGFAAADTVSGNLVRLNDGRLARVARLPFYDPARRLPRAAPL
jgi:glycine cleavage system aminomethyltransferase T